jgi:hypothetical protein
MTKCERQTTESTAPGSDTVRRDRPVVAGMATVIADAVVSPKQSDNEKRLMRRPTRATPEPDNLTPAPTGSR